MARLDRGRRLVAVRLAVAAALGAACNDATLELGRLEGAAAHEVGPCSGESCALDFCTDGVGSCSLERGKLHCGGDVGGTRLATTRDDRSLVIVDMAHATELRLGFEICDPEGYVLNLGDSRSNDGGGGDAWHSSNDAEILIRDDDLHAYSNQLGYTVSESAAQGYHPLLLHQPGYLANRGCSHKTLVVGDQFIAFPEEGLRRESPMALRINPSADLEGVPDAVWYLGVNRVVSARSDRVGGHVSQLHLCFTRELARACEHNGYAEPDPFAFGYPACPATPGAWAGCGAHGCTVCADKLVGYPRYRRNHPCCRPDEACGQNYATCNASCPEPTEADR